MADEPEGVTSTDPPAVEPEPDRPIQNVVGEFNRKFQDLSHKYETLMQYVAANAMTPQSKPASTEGVEDEDLWKLAQQGDRGAFDTYMTRVASRQTQTEMAQRDYGTLIESQLTAIAMKYPVLNDNSHPLSQTAQLAYRLLVGRGYPQNKVTLLEAVKTAIADRPDLVAELHGQGRVARDAVRRSATAAAQSGVTGATYRETPPSTKGKPITKEEAALAARMGVKDPAGAKERFLQRRKEGRSNLGAVGMVLDEEDL